MREILFRGKMVDGLGWIEGSLIKWKHFNGKNYEDTYSIKDLYCNEFLVHPETVGQFTGLLDKNGNRIFEGDVVKVPDDWDEYGFMAGEIREIYFSFGGFRLMPKEGKSYGYYIEDTGVFEIIGNIHDNQELL